MSSLQIPLPGLNIIGNIIQSLKPSMTRFKDELETVLKQKGMAPEDIKRVREVLDSGKDEDMNAKLDELARGKLLDKDGMPIELKDKNGTGIELERETVGELVKSTGVSKKRIDPSVIGPEEWEKQEKKEQKEREEAGEEPADDFKPFVPPTQWVRG